jgi:hypothetical protein
MDANMDATFFIIGGVLLSGIIYICCKAEGWPKFKYVNPFKRKCLDCGSEHAATTDITIPEPVWKEVKDGEGDCECNDMVEK